MNQLNKLFFIIILLFFTINSCEKESVKPNSEVDLITENIAKKILYKSSGTISPDESIEIRFSEDYCNEKIIDDKTIKFNPVIKGKAFCQNSKTLLFKPLVDLPLKTDYQAILNIKDLKSFKFNFSTAGLLVKNIKDDFLLKDINDPKKLFYTAKVVFTVPIKPDLVKKSVSLLVDNGEKKIELSSISSNNKEYNFKSVEIVRDNEPKNFILKINNELLDLSSSIEKKTKLEKLGAVEIKSVVPITHNNKPTIEINFTDELSIRQNISGFITIENQEIKTKQFGKKIYISGNFKHGQNYQLKVNSGILSKWGVKTTKAFNKKLVFNDLKPQISFVNDGLFLPTANKKKILFKTLNLKKINLKIKRVFENNLLQFVQTQSLASMKKRKNTFSDYYVKKVGVELVDKNLDISSEKNKWLSHQLDLNNLIKDFDKGLYLINISFKKDDILYISQNKKKRYYGDYYYNHPYSRGYYYSNASVYKPVIISDIGLTYKLGNNKQIVYANNINNTEPLSNTKIILKTYQNQVIATKLTDVDGKAVFENAQDNIFFIEAETKQQKSFLKLNEMLWDTSSFDVAGYEDSNKETNAYLYTERGVYRPGDQINLSLITRNKNNSFPENHPISLNFYNPMNQIVYKKTLNSSTDGFYNFPLKTDLNDPTGNWKVEVIAGSKYFTKKISIETVVPNRLKVEIETDKKDLDYDEKKLNIKVSSEYLFGAPAKKLNYDSKVNLQYFAKIFDKYKDYYFSNPQMSNTSLNKSIKKGSLDNKGEVNFFWDIPNLSNVPSAVLAKLETKVFEKGGRFTKGFKNVIINPYKSYIGINSNSSGNYLKSGETLQLKVVLADKNGKLIPNKSLSYKIYKNKRFWWWEYDSYDSYKQNFKNDSETELVYQNSILSNIDPVNINYKVEATGEYFIEIKGEEDNSHINSFFFQVSNWGSLPVTDKGVGVISLKTDKSKYKIGDVAKIAFPVPKNSRVLVSLEKGKNIIKHYWHKTNKDSNQTVVDLPITKDLFPNAYFSVSVLQPHSQTLNDRPIRMYGIIPINVEDDSTKQDLIIATKKEFKAKENFSVEVQTKDKKETQLTVSVVDIGLLDLTNFRTPSPWQYFYQKIGLGVDTYDLYSQVIGANKGDLFKTFSIGGDFANYRINQNELKEIKRFEPVSLFKGPLKTDKNGYLKVDFTMPNYVGSVKIMVVSANKNRYGDNEKIIPVKSDLMLLPTAPRLLGPDDEFELPLEVFKMNSDINNVSVKVETDGPLKVISNSNVNLPFKGDDLNIVFKLKADNAIGKAKIKLTVKDLASNIEAKKEIEIVVRPYSNRIYETKEYVSKSNQLINFTIPNKGLNGSNKASIKISKLKKLNLDNYLNQLIRYPYGCIEQTTSVGFPQLYLKNFITNNDQEKDQIDQHINSTINRIRKFQLSNGAFSYWPGNSNPSIWGTNYAGHFLISARDLGYFVPDDLLDNWVRFQKNRAISMNDNFMERVYRVYTLALFGEPELGAMNLLKENHLKQLSNTQKWLLASSYKLAGIESVANEIILSADISVKSYKNVGVTYGSSIRDQAMMLDSILEMKSYEKEANLLYKQITEELSLDKWYSTHTIGYSLISLGKYIEKQEKTSNGHLAMISGYIQDSKGTKTNFSFDKTFFSHKVSSGFGKEFLVFFDQKTNLDQVFVTTDWSGIPLKPDQTEMQNNIGLKVEWLDEIGLSVNPNHLKQGDTIWGHFTVENPKKLNINEIALSQIIPSGWEIENDNLRSVKKQTWMKKMVLNKEEYLDIRDDRIVWFFDLNSSTKKLDFLVKINAVTKGKFILPDTTCEAMYDKKYRALKVGKTIVVN